MKTRKQRLNNEVSHREYFAQFVNDEVKKAVVDNIGLDALLNSKDEHLNDIPMEKWDTLSGYAWRRAENEETMTVWPRTETDILPVEINKLREAGEVGKRYLPSNATLVCIYKEAGKQIIETA